MQWKRNVLAEAEQDQTEPVKAREKMHGGVQSGVQAAYTGRSGGRSKGVQATVQEMFGEGRRREEIRSFLEKRPENRPIERYRWVKILCMVGWGGSVAQALATEAGPLVIIYRSLILIALMVGWDAFRLLGRVLAQPSRSLIAVSLMLWAIFTVTIDRNVGMVAFTVSFATVVLIKLVNLHWLGRETYYMTSRVQEAMREMHTTDIEGYWASTGYKEVIALVTEMGARIHDPVESWVRKAVWLIGFLSGSQAIEPVVTELREAKAEVEKLKGEVEKAAQNMRVAEAKLDDALYNAEYYKSESERKGQNTLYSATELRNYRTQVRDLESQVEKLRVENEALKETNAELLDEIDKKTANISNMRKAMDRYLDENIIDEGEGTVIQEVVDNRSSEAVKERLLELFTTINPDSPRGDYYGLNTITRMIEEDGIPGWSRSSIANWRRENIDLIEEKRREKESEASV